MKASRSDQITEGKEKLEMYQMFYRPRPATQWIAIVVPGSLENLSFNSFNHLSTTSLGGAAPSSKNQSCWTDTSINLFVPKEFRQMILLRVVLWCNS